MVGLGGAEKLNKKFGSPKIEVRTESREEK